jgi:hypothetical protein
VELTPDQLWEAVKDNPVVQWFLVVVFILLVGTNTAARLKGPVGGFARWVRRIGEARENREAVERREARRKLIQAASEGREYVHREIDAMKAEIDTLYQNQDALQRLIRDHLGWDYDRVQDLIRRGVRPGDIPTPPPLRIPASIQGRHRHPDPKVVPEPEPEPEPEPVTREFRGQRPSLT